MANRWGNNGNSDRYLFFEAPKGHLLLRRKAMTNLGSILKSRDITLPICLSSQSYGFSSSHVWMWELDYKESQVLKNWCFWTVVLEKTLESPLARKEIKPVNPKANQSWIFIGRTDPEAETPILWPPDVKNWLIGQDPDAGKDWRQEEKQTIENEMVGWYHWFDEREFEQGPGTGDRQGSLVCCSPLGCKESDMTEWMNWTEEIFETPSETRLKELQKFIRLPEVRLECRPCIHPDPYKQLCPWIIAIKFLTKYPWQEYGVPPFDWQITKVTLSFFTQSFVSEIQFGTVPRGQILSLSYKYKCVRVLSFCLVFQVSFNPWPLCLFFFMRLRMF